MRFEIAPLRKLAERHIDFLDARRPVRPSSLGKHFVGPQLQTVLPLGRREDVHDAAVECCLLGTHMAK